MKTVVYIVQDTKSAQFRYRVKNVAEALEKSKTWRAVWVLKSELSKIDFSKTDLIVILRQAAKDNVVPDFIREAHKHNVKVLFDLDDLISDYRDLFSLMRGTGSRNIFYWIGYFWGIRRIAKKVDGFLATNDFLAKKLSKSFQKPVRVIRNSLNQAQIQISDECLPKKEHSGFVIGYFSGSPTHRKDFEMVSSELASFLQNHEDVKLEIVGYMEIPNEMHKLLDAGRIKYIKLVNYLELQRLMSKVDVNIAPLVLSDFTNCKSELKFFEAGLVETATIASPSFAFSRAISDGKNGFLANPGEWYNKLEFIYQHQDDVKKIAKHAHRDVMENYFGAAFLAEVEHAYEGMSK